jgi:predicted restriction endonuclease
MANNGWTREQLIVALSLYCRLPFGRLHHRNPEIIKFATVIGRTPSALAMKLSNIASLDPAITSSGRTGLPGASAADKEMWEEAQQDWESFALISDAIISTLIPDDPDVEEAIDVEQEDYSSVDKAALRKIRVGQRFFRKTVLSAYDNKCCITGLSIPGLLVASHIVPWQHDISNRLNPMNGLALSVLHDKAFDIGVITINEDMTVRVSNEISGISEEFCQSSLKFYDGKPVVKPEKFSPNAGFLQYHREKVFEKWRGAK